MFALAIFRVGEVTRMDAAQLSREIEDRYTRYLETTFYIRDPELRQSFENALRAGRLVRGPYLEATPNFVRGSTPGELIQSICGFKPDSGFLRALSGDRRLYRHQEQAIGAVARGSHVVVATGTGSGKTESFLFPILLHLYSQYLEGTLDGGVRALILYPMNALAHDQRERLATICRTLLEAGSPFHFTFGQYVGETPEDENDRRRSARDQLTARTEAGHTVVEAGDVVHGEAILRSEMRRRPPHILLTNYSMLEYLLLRPADSPLFDGESARWWKFLVLDEAHQYRGAKGTEMAMLLRRLKQRLREAGCTDSFRCIATSATLASGPDRKESIARFAATLFDERTGDWEVIEGERQPIPPPTGIRLDPGVYSTLRRLLTAEIPITSEAAAAVAKQTGLPLPKTGTDVRDFAARVLTGDDRVRALREILEAGPRELAGLSAEVLGDIPDASRSKAFADFVWVLARARHSESGSPVLSSRYHLFLRALEGAFVSYYPERRVFLDRKSWDGERTAFELALCRECGQHYFVGRRGVTRGRLTEPDRDPTSENFGATYFRPLDGSTMDGSEEVDPTDSSNLRQLCVRCGEIDHSTPRCGHDTVITVVVEPHARGEDRADQLLRCGACGYDASGRDPVREVVHGADGPNTVIATALVSALPPERRKLLAFADGRQEAAFFAWYLDESYGRVAGRNLVRRVVEHLAAFAPEGLSLPEVARGVHQVLQETGILPPEMGQLDKLREAWRRTYAEFLTDEARLSLEGVGLVRWSVKRPPSFDTPSSLLDPPLALAEEEAWDLLQQLLDVMRRRRAVQLAPEPPITLRWEDLGVRGSPTRFRIGSPGGDTSASAWDGERGSVVRLLREALCRNGTPASAATPLAVKIARSVWQELVSSDRSIVTGRGLLIQQLDGRVLNPAWWRISPVRPDDIVFRCSTCLRVQATSVRRICLRHNCRGIVQPIRAADLDRNHYRELYCGGLPAYLRVEEHTAQLDYDTARKYQRDFREGRIHVLSCSTTFELGVDLGDLDVVFLRNVPPETYNYAQRVGRAGRRAGYPGFTITFCRRGPHDLYYFANPERMLRGEIKAPVIHLGNEKIITRHLVAVALAAFFRENPFRFANVEQFFTNLENPSAVEDVRHYLHRNRARLEAVLATILPPQLHELLSLRNGGWIDRVAGPNSRFSQAEAELASDYRAVLDVEKRAVNAKDYTGGARWAMNRARTIREENVLSFLSRKAVIPKYGFPVDVVELDTHNDTATSQGPGNVSLQRDLEIAISEFAPTSEIVANKLLWRSYGLKKVAEREWERWWYTHCPRHHRFDRQPWRGPGDQPQFERCCNRMSTPAVYVSPQFGFVTSRIERPTKPRGRPARMFSTRPYFLGFTQDTLSSEIIDRGAFSVMPVSPGRLVVLAEGPRQEGFYICPDCGASGRAIDRLPRSHHTPLGYPCQGHFEIAALGHEFITDVLRIQFHLQPAASSDSDALALSIAFALVDGAAEILEVPSADLSATVAYRATGTGIQPIVLFDRVPGGAGLVSRLQDLDTLREAIEAAMVRVKGACGCDPATSCYGCLRNYRNQFAHARLQRGLVFEYLRRVLAEWR